jgi:hypothetical protein
MKYLTSSFRVRLPFTFPLALRYILITLLLTGFVLGCWSAIPQPPTPPATLLLRPGMPPITQVSSRSQRLRRSRASTTIIP